MVSKLETLGQLNINDCDQVLDEYDTFVDSAKLNPEFKNFNKSEQRIDSLMYNELSNSANYGKLWEVLKKLLLLSHGQAAIERGFSINKEISDTNMQTKTLISRRIVKDHIKKVGGLKNVVISKELRQYSQSSRSRYQSYLDENKSVGEKLSEQRKRKLQEEEVETLQKRVKGLESDIQFLTGDADKTSLQAEEQRSLILPFQSQMP